MYSKKAEPTNDYLDAEKGQQKAQLVSTGSTNRVVAGDQDKIRKEGGQGI